MANTVIINKNSSKGNLGISKKVFVKITDEAVNRVLEASKDAKNVKIAAPTAIDFAKNGKVNVNISVLLKKGTNPEDICLKLQQEIAHDLAIYTESIPFEIEISIADIK